MRGRYAVIYSMWHCVSVL